MRTAGRDETEMTEVRQRMPLALHALVGVVYIAYTATARCGSDECLGPLFAAVGGVVWLLTFPLVVVMRRAWLPAVAAAVLWMPVAYALALLLFIVFPSLGGAAGLDRH